VVRSGEKQKGAGHVLGVQGSVRRKGKAIKKALKHEGGSVEEGFCGAKAEGHEIKIKEESGLVCRDCRESGGDKLQIKKG